MSRVLIVKTGTTLPALRARRGDYEDWIAAGLGVAREAVDVVRPAADEPLPAPDAPLGIVVTGSSAMVSDREPWSERTAAWLADAVRAGTAVLGICYGHQLLAHGLGGEVGRNPAGREMGTICLRLEAAAADDPLLGGLGTGPLAVQATHRESVLALPSGARGLAASDADRHQAFAVGERAWGVQFHPEFDAEVMRGYVNARRDVLCVEGLDPEAMLSAIRETPAGPAILRRFSVLLG